MHKAWRWSNGHPVNLQTRSVPPPAGGDSGRPKAPLGYPHRQPDRLGLNLIQWRHAETEQTGGGGDVRCGRAGHFGRTRRQRRPEPELDRQLHHPPLRPAAGRARKGRGATADDHHCLLNPTHHVLPNRRELHRSRAGGRCAGTFVPSRSLRSGLRRFPASGEQHHIHAEPVFRRVPSSLLSQRYTGGGLFSPPHPRVVRSVWSTTRGADRDLVSRTGRQGGCES